MVDGGMVWTSPAMEGVIRRAKQFAASHLPVLITGETGVGKDMLAQVIHRASRVSNGPFVAVNCSAFAQGLISSQLFGHERGAFTGADRRHRGFVEQAQDGSMFLDEIGDLPIDQQGHLLRLLEQGTFYRVGGEAELTARVRLIAATNTDFDRAVREHTFREDLFFRLNVLSIHIPPLRERQDDIPALVQRFVATQVTNQGIEVGDGAGPVVGAETMEALKRYRWPGNVRELSSRTARAVLLCPTGVLLPEHFELPVSPPAISTGYEPRRSAAAPAEPVLAPMPVDAVTPIEPRHADLGAADRVGRLSEDSLREALHHSNFNVTQAAKLLGVSRPTIYRWMRRYDIQERYSIN